MPRYLTPEWVESFDAALGALDLSDAVAAAGAGSLAAADGTFSVVQVVTGVPDDVQAAGGDVHLVLTVAGGRARLGLDPSGDGRRHRDHRARLRRGAGDGPRGARSGGRAGGGARARCGATWRRSWPARTCWPRRRRRLGTDLEELTEPPAPAP